MPKRLQRKRTKGWRMGPNGACITRPGIFGNPFAIEAAREAGYRGTDELIAEFCISTYRNWLKGQDSWNPDLLKRVLAALPRLRGKDLYCFCSEGQPCHGDVLLELANR